MPFDKSLTLSCAASLLVAKKRHDVLVSCPSVSVCFAIAT